MQSKGLRKLKKCVMIIVGAGIMGVSLDLFLVPAQVAAGGVSGLATVIHYVTGLSMGWLILLINLPIFVLGSINFSHKFILYSLLGTAALSVSSQAFAAFPPLTEDLILSSVFGGGFLGLGLGLALRAGGTTGGTDILSLVFRKFFPSFSVGQFFLIIDGAVILLAGLVFGRWETILYSSVALYISSRVVDTMLEGVDFAKMVYIISDHPEDITAAIYRQVERGITALSGVSMYTGRQKQVLLCVIRTLELPRLKRVVQQVDRNAFVIVSDAREVLGKGFKEE